ALLLGVGGRLAADIVWDYSPATTGADISPPDPPGGAWVNQAQLQNFAEHFIFSTPTQIDGMDIYTRPDFATVGQSARIGLRADGAGTPGALLADFTLPISIVDTLGTSGPNQVRAHVDFTTPLMLMADTTYWIGMSGTTTELGQLGLSGPRAPDDSRM